MNEGMRCKRVLPVLPPINAVPIIRRKAVVGCNVEQLNLQKEPVFFFLVPEYSRDNIYLYLIICFIKDYCSKSGMPF